MLTEKRIVLGITGGIAVYKAADLASKLTQAGAKVDVIMTEAATEFVAPLTFRTLTRRPVITDVFESAYESGVTHVALGEEADIIVIAPATANTIARLSAGIADDMLTCTVLATEAPVLIAPAMNVNMWENQATQDNVSRLEERGFTIIEPGYGRLANGRIGKGRLTETDNIIGAIRHVLGQDGDLAGRQIVVTAGGTREAIDPVRYIGNRSSGKMGFALAEAARDRGADVVLVVASTSVPAPTGMEVVQVESAAEMKEAVSKATTQADALIMAAAVADYQPKDTAVQKIKKGTVGTDLSLELVETPDIISEVSGKFLKIGFAAETENLLENAKQKLQSKKLDMMVANDVTAADSGFGTDTNRVIIINSEGKSEEMPLMSKRQVADKVLDRVATILQAQGKD